MITNITLENFKCFRHVSINPKLLTVLIGPNGTGKSSVLQALLLLKQSLSAGETTYQEELISLGDSADISPSFLEKRQNRSISLDANGFPLPSDSRRAAIEKLRFVPPVRGLIRPSYEWGEDKAEQISSQHGLGAQEEQLATNLAWSGPWVEDKLSELLKKITGTGLRVMDSSGAIEVKSLTQGGLINIVAEGFGANALIQLLHQLIIADKGATVLIEEPEIHLHPKAQADLAEVLAETAKAEDKQIIMTTHSEYVAGRLLTLVAEGQLTVDDLAIYSFEKDEKGECLATEIEVTERGQVKGGLTGFHEATRDEMRRYADGLRNSA